MGWTGTYRAPGITDRAFFEREFPTMLTQYGEVVACATVRGAFYAAVRNNDTGPYLPGETWALVVLIRRGRGDYNFTYKEMDENMGPGVDDAPAAVLDALSPTDHEHAAPWRARCRANLAAKAARPTVKRGSTVTFAVPVTFISGATLQTFTFVERSTFQNDTRRYHIRSWRARQYAVRSAA